MITQVQSPKRQIVRYYLVICLLLSVVFCNGQNCPIIPQPHSVLEGQGEFTWSVQDSFTLSYSSSMLDEVVSKTALDLFIQTLQDKGLQIQIRITADPSFQFSLRRDAEIHADNVPSNFVLPKEGYWLKILPNEIIGSADDPAGLLYAVQSLRQLFHGQGATFHKLNCVTIIDYPKFDFRGIMDDVSRGPLSTLAFMKKQVERLSYYKLNVLGFYIEHVIRTQSHPEFSPSDALTPNELSELSQYASKYNVTILGGFQSLGHFRSILKSPKYQHLGVGDRMLIPGDSAALQFLYEVYQEIIPSCSNPIFHINCDEAYDLSRGHLKPKADSLGEATLFSDHITPLLEKVSDLGKRPAIWGDMLAKYPSVLKKIPQETLVFAWDYGAESDFSKWIDPINQAGFEFVACPGIVNSYKLWPDLIQSQANMRRFSSFAFENNAQGVFTTVWDDGGRHFFHTDWPGVAYAAAYAWLPDSTAQSDFNTHYDLIHFQDTSQRFSSVISTLSKMKFIPRLSRLNNQLLEINYGSSGQGIECLDTTDFLSIQREGKLALHHIQELINQHPKINPQHKIELEIWTFKITELLLNLKTAETLLKIDRDNLGPSTIIDLNALVSKWQEKAHKFEILWRLENRSYWLSEAQELYWKKAETLHKICSVFKASVQRDPKIQSETHSVPAFSLCDGFSLQYWLGAGSFDGTAGLTFDYFKDHGGEEHIRPSAVDYFTNQDGQDQGWNKIISNRSGVLNFADFYSDEMESLAYASITIDSKIDQDISVSLYSPSDLKFFVNGIEMEVHDLEGPSQYSFGVSKGRNYLLIKSLNRKIGKWEFSFRILNQLVRQNKYRYYLE